MAINKTVITLDGGTKVEAIAPIIISASRSTDIPAFYAQWFINRLKDGYCAWYNPFNKQKMYVSFANCKVVVFWTKNPKPMMPFLSELDKRGIHYYFQVTLNDYEMENFEPNVPALQERISTFKQLSNLIGREKVIWRFDPLILTSSITPDVLIDRVKNIGDQLKGYTDKLVFSFIDVKAYRKVQNNLVKDTSYFTKDTIDSAEIKEWQQIALVEKLVKLREKWHNDGWNITFATCAENIDLEKYGIEHNRCIDGELMKRIFAEDKELLYYLYTGKLPERDLFGDISSIPEDSKNLKDKGQRKICGCMESKDIGMYNTCPHLCVYCYANTSRKCVLDNMEKVNVDSESIIG